MHTYAISILLLLVGVYGQSQQDDTNKLITKIQNFTGSLVPSGPPCDFIQDNNSATQDTTCNYGCAKCANYCAGYNYPSYCCDGNYCCCVQWGASSDCIHSTKECDRNYCN